MLAVKFGMVTLSKAASYLILLLANAETQRTNVSEWTSNPIFDSLEVDESVQTVELKLCEANSGRKLKIVGSTSFQIDASIQKEVLFEGELRLQQEVEGQGICVGIAYITVSRVVNAEEFPVSMQNNKGGQSVEQVGEEQQLQQQEEAESNEEVRLQFHCGFGFYLGSSFRFEVEWGKHSFSSQSIRDKINPVWSETACLSGPAHKQLELRMCDQKNNVLENIRFNIAELRVMFTYHLRIRFKQQIMGATPQVFVSIVRQSFPLFSIAEIPIRFHLKSLGEACKPLSFVMVSLNKQLKLPTFIELDRSKMSSLQLINKYINSKSAGEEDRIEMVAVPKQEQSKSFSILKSYLSRKLYLHFITVAEIRAVFQDQNAAAITIMEARADLQAILRRVYYNSETFTLKKYFQISNPQQLAEPQTNASAKEKWRVLSNNYILRNDLVLSSRKHIEDLRKNIEAKGEQIVQLKKVIIAVRNISHSLTAKEKLMNSIKAKKVKYNLKEITNEQLIAALISTQGQLEQKKNINAELALRMDCLADVHENQQDLSAQVVQNAQTLLEQQAKLQKMRLMQREILKQRQLIAELEKLFESREMDRRVNQALEEQSQRLAEMRQRKQEDLMEVYKKVRHQKYEGSSMQARVKRAQEALINLNEQYARMVAL